GLIELVKRAEPLLPSVPDALDLLRHSGVRPEPDSLRSAIWDLRDQWKLAFLVFKWREEECLRGDEKAWSLMIWVLGSCRKFNVAWSFIRDLHKYNMDARRAMLIMIERYAANGDPGKAIRTFQIMEKLNLSTDPDAFYDLLRFLCVHGSLEEAEDFMLNNKKLFPLSTEGFNIILDGWCNLSDVSETKRVWREMSRSCVNPDEATYAHLIRCFSNAGNLFDSLRLYDGMQNKGWKPGSTVYNSLIYVLARENCLKEALKMMEKMKESGLQPDSCSYNSLIRPLCEADRIAEARVILCIMIKESIEVDRETYHAILLATSYEGTVKVLDGMRKARCCPSADTFLLLIAKFYRLDEPENAVRIWGVMKQYNVLQEASHYQTMIRGLVACGWREKAGEVYAEMRGNGIRDDPKVKLLLRPPKEEKRKIKNELR
uniref:Pentatricopeptide repeat-containing protein n=1 Tax=Kalanchoe fedtschenkoi TaxID=63787 RepID=A0A7N0TFZ8_KALFE